MSDIYGMQRAVRTCAEIYFRSAIMSGRTTHLIELVRDGDCVVFHSDQAKREFNNQLKQTKNRHDVKLVVVLINKHAQLDNILIRKVLPITGQILFDHQFIEQYLLTTLDSAENELKCFTDHFQKQPPKQQPTMIDRRWDFKL